MWIIDSDIIDFFFINSNLCVPTQPFSLWFHGLTYYRNTKNAAPVCRAFRAFSSTRDFMIDLSLDIQGFMWFMSCTVTHIPGIVKCFKKGCYMFWWGILSRLLYDPPGSAEYIFFVSHPSGIVFILQLGQCVFYCSQQSTLETCVSLSLCNIKVLWRQDAFIPSPS